MDGDNCQTIFELPEIIIECSWILQDKDEEKSTHQDGIGKKKKL